MLPGLCSGQRVDKVLTPWTACVVCAAAPRSAGAQISSDWQLVFFTSTVLTAAATTTSDVACATDKPTSTDVSTDQDASQHLLLHIYAV